MVFVKNVKYCEAECGENIWNFAKELVGYRKETECDVIGKFNDICIEVKKQTTERDIIDFYRQYM
ncbi:MAG: hypothetical protein UH850_14760 [Paludibacteraceae bacterium]|nr:hypothetical protein [Paludibacteraceae bacterium]